MAISTATETNATLICTFIIGSLVLVLFFTWRKRLDRSVQSLVFDNEIKIEQDSQTEEEEYEPEPKSDPIAKRAMMNSVLIIEKSWAGVPPILDSDGLKVWHRPDGGTIHSFKYEVVMPLAPMPCVALAKEVFR